MTHPEHIHTPDDGRGRRIVLLNGKEIPSCTYADTRKGKVRYIDEPARLNRWRKRIIEHTAYGKVEVIDQGTWLLKNGERVEL